MKKILAAAIAAVSIGGAASAFELQHMSGDIEEGRILVTEIEGAEAVLYTWSNGYLSLIHISEPTRPY